MQEHKQMGETRQEMDNVKQEFNKEIETMKEKSNPKFWKQKV